MTARIAARFAPKLADSGFAAALLIFYFLG